MHAMSRKERLNLTVRDDFKNKAATLAEKRRRSISALFEDLIDEEWERTGRSKEEPKIDYGKKSAGKSSG
jgi:predicted transcriptional regulator